MMCILVRLMIPSHSRDELHLPFIRIIERHLRKCPKCSAELNTYRRSYRAFLDVFSAPLPMSRVSWEAVRSRIANPASAPAWHRLWLPITPIALGALVFVALNYVANREADKVADVAAAEAPRGPISAGIGVPVVKVPQIAIESAAEPQPRRSVRVTRITVHRPMRVESRKDPFERLPDEISAGTTSSANITDANGRAGKRRPPGAGESATPPVTEINVKADGPGANQVVEHESTTIQWGY